MVGYQQLLPSDNSQALLSSQQNYAITKFSIYFLDVVFFFQNSLFVLILLFPSKLYSNSIQKMRRQILPIHLRQRIEEMFASNTFAKDTLYEITKNMSYYSLECLLPFADKHRQVINSIKMLVLMHNILFSDCKNREETIDKIIRAVQPHVEGNNCSFQAVLLQKLIIPYKLYLLKRNIYHEQQVQKDSQAYILINLIQTALSFINVIFTLGRYLLKQYPFLNEFNIIIAKDMAMLYRKLKAKMNQNFSAQHAEIIQNLNENLYTVFYNCYFNRSVSIYAPSWIDTDKLFDLNEEESRVGLKKNKKITGSYKQLERLSFQGQSTNLSICLDINDSSAHDLKSFSTIASHRQVEREESASEKQIRERLQFIATASLLLGELKEEEEDEDPIPSQVSVY